MSRTGQVSRNDIVNKKHISVSPNRSVIPSAMSGRGGGRGQNGRTAGRGGRDHGRGANYSGQASAKARGMCKDLNNYVFDYGQKGSADEMRITWEKIVYHVGTIHGSDISNELQNKKRVVLEEPKYSQDIKDKHAAKELRKIDAHRKLSRARSKQVKQLQTAVKADREGADVELALLEIEIDEANFQSTEPLPYKLTEEEKTRHDNEWRSYRAQNEKLKYQRGMAYSMVRGQCMTVLLDKMKQDSDFQAVSESYDPLRLYALIEKIVLTQTDDQYPFATVYDQETSFYKFMQEKQTNNQWYERFNTKVDVSEAIGVTRQHKVLLEFVAKHKHSAAFDTLSNDRQLKVRE